MIVFAAGVTFTAGVTSAGAVGVAVEPLRPPQPQTVNAIAKTRRARVDLTLSFILVPSAEAPI